MKFIKKEWQPLARPNGEDMNDLEQRILEISDTDSSTPQVVDVGNNLNFNPLYHPVFGQMDVGSIVSFASGENPNTGNPFSSSGPSGLETNPPVVGTIERASSTIFIMTIRPQGTNFTDVLDWRERIFSNNTWREWRRGSGEFLTVNIGNEGTDNQWHQIDFQGNLTRSGDVVTLTGTARELSQQSGNHDFGGMHIATIPSQFRGAWQGGMTGVGISTIWGQFIGMVVVNVDSNGHVFLNGLRGLTTTFSITYVIR